LFAARAVDRTAQHLPLIVCDLDGFCFVDDPRPPTQFRAA